MGNNKLILFVIYVLLSVECLPIVSDVNYVNDNGYTNKFKVIRIKSEKEFYIIYAERNDTLFKILSPKKNVKEVNNEKIREKGEYYLSLQTLFPRYIRQTKCPPPGTTGRMGIDYYGHTVPLETEHDIWDIYEATNLRGLYIIKKLDNSHIELFDKPFY